MKTDKNTIDTKNKLSNKLQEITERLDILQIKYNEETNQLKEELADLLKEIDNLSDEGYQTAEEQITEREEIPIAIPAVVVPIGPQKRSRSLRDPFPLPPYPKYKKRESLRVGDIVQITNDYKKQFGVVGKVFRLEDYWVWLKDRDGIPYQRARFNVRKAQDPVNYGYYKRNGEYEWPGWIEDRRSG